MRKKLGRLLAATLTLYSCAQAAAQEPMPSGADFHPPPVTMQQAFAFNVAVGGGIAAFRAHIAGRSAWSAFKTGALGGGVHFLGKEIGIGRWGPSGVLGTVVASTGASIVANASEGRAAFSELSVPVSAVRLRFTPGAPHIFHASLNAFYAGILVHSAFRPAMRYHWGHSAYAFTPVFLTDKRIKSADVFPGGVTDGSNVVITTTTDVSEADVLRHEATHVRQFFLLDEAIGQPLERRIRQMVPGVRRTPAWLEFGFVSPAIIALDYELSPSRRPLYRWLDGEAAMFERR
jgi:hypothetical protein